MISLNAAYSPGVGITRGGRTAPAGLPMISAPALIKLTA